MSSLRVMVRLAIALVLAAPASLVLTFSLGPLWGWVEARFGIESVGHALYAGWCFVASYIACAALASALALLVFPKPRRANTPRSG